MAPKPKKRLALVDDPPTASSSDEEQPPSTQKPADKVVNEQDEDSSSEEEGDEEGSSSEEEEDNQTQQTPSKDSKPASKNPPPSTPISTPKPAESESGSESGTESDSEPEQKSEPTPPPNPKVKPLASKRMKTQTQAQAQSTPVLTKSGTKRVAESSTGNDSKRSKKKTITAGGGSDDENEVEEDAKLTGEDSKKNFQRVFSEEDELVILKGLGDFVAKTGKDPMKETAAFHSFVKKLLKADANAEQLKRKVRCLKKKFESSDNFTKPHDKRAFDLFKVWSKNASKEAEENGKSNEKIAKSAKKEAPVKNVGSAKKELAIVTKNVTGKVESGVGKSFILRELVKFDEAAGIAVLDKDAAESGLELMGESDRVELEERWKKLQAAEMEVFLNRAEVVREQTRLALQELKKKSSKQGSLLVQFCG